MKILRRYPLVGVLIFSACIPQGPPLTKAECQQLLRHQDEVLSTGLQGEDLDEFNSNSAASFDVEVNDCVKGRSWTRSGFDCVMAARTHEEMAFCPNRN